MTDHTAREGLQNEDWESLAIALCEEEGHEPFELIWEGGPIPEPWGDRWMKYEHDAKRMIELVRTHAAAPTQPQGGAMTPAIGWTGDADANAALLMLDRLDVPGDDDARVDAIAATIRRLAAPQQAADGLTTDQVEALAMQHGLSVNPSLLCFVRDVEAQSPALLAAPAAAPVDELSDDRIQKLWDEACKDGPGRPGWSRHIRFAKTVAHHAIAAFLERTRQYVTNDASREAAIADAIAASAQQDEREAERMNLARTVYAISASRTEPRPERREWFDAGFKAGVADRAAQQVQADQPNYKARFDTMVYMIGEISQALGISDDDAACANGNDLILTAISKLRQRVQADAGAVADEDDTPAEILCSRLIDAWCEANGGQIPWDKAVEITAITTKLPDAERLRLLSLDDDAPVPADRRTADLAALVRHLAYQLRKVVPDHDVANHAVDYLKREGLQGSPMRLAAMSREQSRENGGERGA